MLQREEFRPAFGSPAYWSLARRIMFWSFCLQMVGGFIRSGPVARYIKDFTSPGAVTFGPREEPLLMLILLSVVLMPIVEEICFRAWLIPEKAYLVCGIGVLSGFWAVVCVRGLDFAMFFLLAALLLLGLKACIYTGSGGDLNRRPTAVLWFASALATVSFALVHLTNYTSHAIPVLMLPLLVAPQIFSGICLTYARLRLGLGMSMFMHGMWNFFLLGLGVLASSGA